MKNTMKRSISALLCLAMLIGLVPGSVFAADLAPVQVVYDFCVGGGTLTYTERVVFPDTYTNTRNWKYFDVHPSLEAMMGATEWTFDNGVYRSATTTPNLAATQDRTLCLRNTGLSFCTGPNQGQAQTRDGWFAFKLEAPTVPGVYSVDGLVGGWNIKNVDIWLAPYIEGEDDGEFYLASGLESALAYSFNMSTFIEF